MKSTVHVLEHTRLLLWRIDALEVDCRLVVPFRLIAFDHTTQSDSRKLARACPNFGEEKQSYEEPFA